MIKSAYITFLSCFLLGWQVAQAQVGVSDRINQETDRAASPAAMLKAADKAFAEGDFYTSMQYSYRIVQIDSSNEAALDGFGKSAVALSAFERADTAYQMLVEQKLDGLDGLAVLHWADVKFRLGQFEEAKKLYARFLAGEKPADTPQSVLERAKESSKNAEWAADMLLNDYSDIPLTFLEDVNTVEFSEFSPLLWRDTLYYSSYSFPFKKDKKYPQRHLIKVMEGTQQGDSLAVAATDFNEDDLHTAHVSFNQAGDVMYYTVCEFIATAIIRCDLYQRRQTKDGNWGPAMKLPANVNAADFTTTEPSVGRAPNDDQEVLYFVSDRPGGQGKRDLWYSAISRDSFSTPVNLSALNTKEDEVTPFYHSKSETLYFSTTGRRTLGGFDIYRAKGFNNQWTAPEHTGLPFNSIANDVYYTLGESGQFAFLASNRRGSFNESEEACCYDIYRAEVKPPTPEPARIDLVATIFDKDTKLAMPGATVRFTDLGAADATSKGDIPTRTDVHPDNNRYDYELQFNHNYKVVASKAGYTIDSSAVTTVGLSTTQTLTTQLYLRRGIDLKVLSYDYVSKEPLNAVNFRLVEITPTGRKTIGEFTSPSTGNLYHTTIDFKKRYLIVGTKEGYSRDSLEFNTEEKNIQEVDFQTIVQKLYLRPLILERYLPIKLYYDNDEPDKRTMARSTKQEYRATYVTYIRRKQEFIKIFTEGMTGDELQQERDTMDMFFERDIRGGWNKLMSFSEILYELMSRGDKIELTLKGYASPRAGSAYNLNLTARRVSSVLNHFLIFDGGIYKKFVESGQLVIKLEPNGEAKAPPGINDNIDDVRRSWYSVPASRERRLEIIGVQINTNKKI